MIGATRGKLALVAVLAVVFVGTIVSQFNSSSNNVATSPNNQIPAANEQHVVRGKTIPETSAKTTPETSDKKSWPHLSIDKIVAFDPLAKPFWYLAATSSTNSTEQDESLAGEQEKKPLILADMQQQGTSMILITDNQRIATIGGQELRVGDRVQGYQVSDITAQGVVLTKSKSR